MIYFLQATPSFIEDIRGQAEDIAQRRIEAKRREWLRRGARANFTPPFPAESFDDVAKWVVEYAASVKVGFTSKGKKGADKRKTYWETRHPLEDGFGISYRVPLRFARRHIQGKAMWTIAERSKFMSKPRRIEAGTMAHEQAMHYLFANANIEGEWFKSSVLSYFETVPQLKSRSARLGGMCVLCEKVAAEPARCCSGDFCDFLCVPCKHRLHFDRKRSSDDKEYRLIQGVKQAENLAAMSGNADGMSADVYVARREWASWKAQHDSTSPSMKALGLESFEKEYRQSRLLPPSRYVQRDGRHDMRQGALF